ncbi:MAG: hypothetical protein P8J37_16550 [Fuerstiella sp.]|nr:hypothetical protein [Fuerstiella sp.]
MNRKMACHALVFTFAAVVIAGCSDAPAPSSGAAPKAQPSTSTPRIALVMKSLANEFFSTMAQGATDH